MMNLNLNDVIRLKKPHACGGLLWKIVRAGADYKILCLTCGHTVLLERDKLLKQVSRHKMRVSGNE